MVSPFEKVWTALWTPTDANGKILKSSIKEHIQFLKNAGIEGLVVGGSTGEFCRLTLETRLALLDWVMYWAGDLPVIVNISDDKVGHVKTLAKDAVEKKVAGVLVLPPSYYDVPQEDLVTYFTFVASLTGNLPFLLYNFPDCVRNTIDTQTILQLADKIPLAGMKQSGANFDYHRDLITIARKKNFTLLSGADTRLPEVIAIGVTGSIGGCSNAVPELIKGIFYGSRRHQNVDALQAKIVAIDKLIAPIKFPYDVAALMQARGLDVGADKTPRSQASLERQKKIVSELKPLLK